MNDKVRKLNKPTRVQREVLASDSLVNLVANMGTGNDKLSNSFFAKSRSRLSQQELAALYRENFIAGKANDIVPDDMTREWRSFADSGLDENKIKEIENLEKQLKLSKKVNQALKWARLYGGSIIILDIEGTGEPWEPLDLDAVKPGALKNAVVFDSENASYTRINQTDPFAENFQMPETYRLARTAVEIHHTRVLRFDGIELPQLELQKNRYWHDSIHNRAYNELRNLGVSLDSMAGLMFESNVDVIKIPDLMQMLSTDKGTSDVASRFMLSKKFKSDNNITLIGGDEEYQNVSKSFAGIPDVVVKFLNVISSVYDVPMTRLFGVSPGGLNATGESDLRNYYDSVASDQNNDLDPQLQYFDQIMSRSLGINPEDMNYDWNPLWQLSDKETSEIELNNANTAAIYLDRAVIKPSQVAEQLMSTDTYIAINPEYIEELQKLEEEPLDEPDPDDSGLQQGEENAGAQQEEDIEEEFDPDETSGNGQGDE